MELKKIAVQLNKISTNTIEIEKAVVSVFCSVNGLKVSDSSFMNNYLNDVDNELSRQIKEIFKNNELEFNVYNLVELYELLIPASESKVNGMVYTPANIKEYILKTTLVTTEPPTVCDPSCGCGSFLLSAAEYIHEKHHLKFNDIFNNYIYGVDIISHNIDKCKVLFHLLALIHNEVLDGKFNLSVSDSLTCNWRKIFRLNKTLKFDCVIGNPPYVRSKNISDTVKNGMKLWQTSKSGNVDLYIPFYELGLKLLKDNGRLGYISPNTFLQSVNGRNLRLFLKKSKFQISILDFRETQIFKNVTSYTCISLVDKSKINDTIKYALLNGKSSLDDYNFTQYNYSSFSDLSPWRLGDKKIDDIIYKIENAGEKLDSFKIRNGLATLKNDIFFFSPLKQDKKYYYRVYKEQEYKIEKEVCINVAKPNVIKTEQDLIDKMEKAIFPYFEEQGKVVIIDKLTMKSKYPYAYAFLLSVKTELDARDKGNGKYPEWYAYGRTQGMQNFGKKLLIPYISDYPVAVLSKDADVLFYCGYAIFSDDEKELQVLKKLLETDVFWFYILNTSKPYSKGYMSFAKNYIKNFGLPVLTNEQKTKLLSLKKKESINSYVKELYNVEFQL